MHGQRRFRTWRTRVPDRIIPFPPSETPPANANSQGVLSRIDYESQRRILRDPAMRHPRALGTKLNQLLQATDLMKEIKGGRPSPLAPEQINFMNDIATCAERYSASGRLAPLVGNILHTAIADIRAGVSSNYLHCMSKDNVRLTSYAAFLERFVEYFTHIAELVSDRDIDPARENVWNEVSNYLAPSAQIKRLIKNQARHRMPLKIHVYQECLRNFYPTEQGLRFVHDELRVIRNALETRPGSDIQVPGSATTIAMSGSDNRTARSRIVASNLSRR